MKANWLAKNKTELIILAILGLIFNIAIYFQMHGFSISFLDTDDYMRLIRIRDFFTHFNLSDNVIKRCNVPFGCSLHWTRFYDFFLIVPSYFLSFFTKSIDSAIEYVGFFISPIVKTIMLIFLFRITLNLFSRKDAFLAVALFAVHPIVSPFVTFGRPDHHAFIMLFMVMTLDSVISFINSKFTSGHIKLAILTSLCIWISPETLIPLLLCDAVLFLHAIFDSSKKDSSFILRKLCLKNLLSLCFIGIIILPSVSDVYYDAISIVHFALYICITSFFYASYLYKTSTKKVYFLKLFLVFIILASAFLYMYPKFFFGMSADISPFVKKIWLSKISEMKSPFEHGDNLFFVFYAIIIIVSVINKIKEIPSIIWWILILNTICYTILSAFASRMLPFSVLFGFSLIVDLGMNSGYFKKFHRLTRITLTFFMAILFMFFTAYFDGHEESADVKEKKYSQRELFHEIDKLSATPVVIMAHSNDGPSLLYYTKHSVVGAPYHRQIEGIIASYRIMEDEYNLDSSKKILTFVDASYIFIKKSMYNKNKMKNTEKSSLAQMIIEGKGPRWISIVKLPSKFDDVIIAKIDKELMLKTDY